METYFIEKKFSYDGSQLQSLYAYLQHGVLGPSVVSWVGACNIPAAHMVDGEDLLANAVIQGDEMLHFIIEIFDRDLFTGVSLQRLFAALAKDHLQSAGKGILLGKQLRRDGDDIFLDNKKLSISIASKSPVSVMIHFAVNITNKGTPVETLSLQDLQLEAQPVAEALMSLFRQEYESITAATRKVRPLP